MRFTQDIRRLLYAFKRDWGTVIDYTTILSSETNDRTGETTIKREILHIPAVLLPKDLMRKFVQDIGYLAANKNFTYGGLNDFNTAMFILDITDLPTGFKPNLNGYVVQGHQRYDKVSIDDLAGCAFILTCKAVEGALPYALAVEPTYSTLQLKQRVDYELN